MEEFTCLLEDRGVYKKILEPGSGYSPKKDQEVCVHYKGAFEDETIFDQNENFVFKMGVGDVIKGWDVGIATMKKGEIAILVIRYDYGYGVEGYMDVIQPYSTLIFLVELVDFYFPNDKQKKVSNPKQNNINITSNNNSNIKNNPKVKNPEPEEEYEEEEIEYD